MRRPAPPLAGDRHPQHDLPHLLDLHAPMDRRTRAPAPRRLSARQRTARSTPDRSAPDQGSRPRRTARSDGPQAALEGNNSGQARSSVSAGESKNGSELPSQHRHGLSTRHEQTDCSLAAPEASSPIADQGSTGAAPDMIQWVFRSRREQGLPDRVEDVDALRQVARLLHTGKGDSQHGA